MCLSNVKFIPLSKREKVRATLDDSCGFQFLKLLGVLLLRGLTMELGPTVLRELWILNLFGPYTI